MNFLIGLLLAFPAALLAPAIHEWTKARVSSALGDTLPKNNGFITFNPFKFFEPIGFIFMMYFQVGWGQPVPTSPLYYKDRRKGIMLTYLTPIVANLFIGLFTAAIWSFFVPTLSTWVITTSLENGIPWLQNVFLWLRDIVLNFARFNVGLALFNLIPIHPMAGNKLIQLFVSPEACARINHFEKPMQILLFILLLFGVVNGLLVPVRESLLRMVWLA